MLLLVRQGGLIMSAGMTFVMMIAMLLPKPQEVQLLEGAHKILPDRFILLKLDHPGEILPAGQMLQAALEKVGPRMELTASAGEDAGRIGAVLWLDPQQVPKAQGYRLTITLRQIQLVAHDRAGLFHGVQTLKQLARMCAGRGVLPCVKINDWPNFAHRGVMLDISRDRVPTMETLYQLIDLLAEWKINQFQLYTEHTFAYRNHKTVWEKASPMTGEQIMQLDAYCRERFIDLVPNQNSFGHMGRWLKHKRYNHLAEAPKGCDTVWGWMEPFSLCPDDPGSIELISELFDELLSHFSAKMVNVGCDETVDLGEGRSMEICLQRGKGVVYLDFLLKIYEQAKKHDCTMQFWGDIILHHPELISRLPKDIIVMEWGYEADHPFAADGQKFKAAGVPYYVCPGTSTWNSVAGRTDNALANLRNAAENGLANGAIGYLITNWGDNGHWQQLPASLLGYAYGAGVSWNVQGNRDMNVQAVLDTHAFEDRAKVTGKILYELGNAYKITGAPIGNNSILHRLLLRPDMPMEDMIKLGLRLETLRKTQDYIKRATTELDRAAPSRFDGRLVRDEIRFMAALLSHACQLGIARFEAPDGKISSIPVDTRGKLADDLKNLIAEHRRLWLIRSRPGGLPDSTARLEILLKNYQADEKLSYHQIKTDAQGNIIPWYSSDLGKAYDHIINLVWNFWHNMRIDKNGLPYYMNHQVWLPDVNDGRGIGGDQLAMALSSWRLLYAYTGNQKIVDNMEFMADYYLTHSLSSPDCQWPNIPYPYNTDIYSGKYDGDMILGKWFTQPDKGGSFGYELVMLYKLTGNKKYLLAAEKIANTLADNVKTGDNNNSPLPFKIHTQTGQLGKIEVYAKPGESLLSSYTTNWAGTLSLFMELIDLNKKNRQAYQKAFDIILTWMKEYPVKTNKWGPFFEDVEKWSDTQINAGTFAMFILEHPQFFPNWKKDVRGALDWVYSELGNEKWENYGVVVVDEQTAYRMPGNSHTARQGAMELLYAEKTADESKKELAVRQLNWATYMVNHDGINTYPYDSTWMTDGYGDYVRHYLRAMAACPELAPSDQEHLLRSTSVVQEIAYHPKEIRYNTFDNASTETLRMTTKPKRITVNGKVISETINLNAEGWTWQTLKDGGVLKIKHQTGSKLVISK